MEHFFEFILHAFKDTLPLLPWILLFYIVIQLLESKIDLNKANNLNGKLGPLVGAATGLVPQCGFSVMAAKLFDRKYITLGTLFAIFSLPATRRLSLCFPREKERLGCYL